MLAEVGALIWSQRGGDVFSVASSGLEYALVAHWRDAGLLPTPPAPEHCGAVDRLLVVSGSCSAVTAAQIAWAAEHGFVPIRLDAEAAADPARRPAEIERTVASACSALQEGRDVVVLSAQGPDDAAIGALRESAARAGCGLDEAQREVARSLGTVLAQVVPRAELRRVAVAGGDTSGYAASQLGIVALEAVAPLDPGSPLCRAHPGPGGGRDGLQVALKGGQVGRPEYFGCVKGGGRPAFAGI